MRFSYKLSFTIFTTGLCVLILLSFATYLFNYNSVIKTQSKFAESIANEISEDINYMLSEKVKIALTLGNSNTIIQALDESIVSYADLPDQKRKESIKQLNDKWKSTKDPYDKFVLEYTDNKAAQLLKKQQKLLKGEYGEIFLTNKFGALVASTSKLSTFSHGHKYWWQRSFNNEKGNVFFDDRGYDESVGGYVLGLVVPIKKGTKIIGILKCNLNIIGSISESIPDIQDKLIGKIKLIRSGGMVIFEEGFEPLSTYVHDNIIEQLKINDYRSIIINDSKEKYLVGLSKIKLTEGKAGYGFGGVSQSIGHKKGNKGESWYILCYRQMSTVQAPVIASIKSILLIGVTILAVLLIISYLFGINIARPLIVLNKATKKIGKGDFECTIDISQNDELGDLAQSFSQMADKLRQTTTSIELFEKEIEDRKKAESALQENELFIRTVMDNLPIGVAVNSVNPDVKFSYMNNNFFRIYRTTREALADPDAFWESVYEDPVYREDIKKKILDDCASGDPKRMIWEDVPITRKGEETTFINAGNTPLPEKQLMISTVWDVSLRKRAEEALRKSEMKYKRLSENTPAIVYQLKMSPDGEFTFPFINDEVKSVMGVSAEDIMLDPSGVFTMVHPDDQKIHLEGIKKSAKSLQLYHETIRFLKNGEELWIEARSTPKKMKDESIIWDGFMIDITEKKKNEEERNILEARLQQSQKMESIGTLAGGIAHDFNNILFPIIGFAEMLKEDLPPDSSEYENAQEIFNAGKRGGELVKQILAFSRQADHKLRPIRIQKILKEVLKLTRSSIPTDIEIHHNIQQGCGLIMAEPTQLHQIGMNLITNAYHALEKTGGKISVQLKETMLDAGELKDSSLKSGQYAMLSVSDNGVGISHNVMSNIFEPYFTTKDQGKGTGLGLAVVFGIVKEFKGDIKFSSKEGKGTTFNVYLPLIKNTTETFTNDRVLVLPTGTENLLLVDDEESVVRLEKQMLERLGYNVSAMSNSLEALEIFNSNPDGYDLVISDMTMPNMTGDKLAKEILAVKSDMPVIICTGFSERINKEHAEAIGVSGFLMKPVVKFEMAQMVRKVLDGGKIKRK